MKKIIILILFILSANIFAKKQKEISMFIKDGDRGMTHVGISKFSFDKVAINLGGDYLFNITDELFAGFTIDTNLLKYKYLKETSIVDLTSIGSSIYLEVYDDKNSSFDILGGLGLMIVGLFSWDDYGLSPFVGASYNYKKFFFKVKYTYLGIDSSSSDYIISFAFGFLLDLRPKKLNKGYYNDEL